MIEISTFVVVTNGTSVQIFEQEYDKGNYSKNVCLNTERLGEGVTEEDKRVN